MTRTQETPRPRLSIHASSAAYWIQEAVDRYSDAELANAALVEAYAIDRTDLGPTAAGSFSQYVAGLHQRIGFGLKASISAAAIATAITAEEASR